MFRSTFVAASRACAAQARSMSTTSTGLNVAVLGAAGGIGQPLSLLLNTSNKFAKLSLFDIVNTPGVAADVGHCNTATKVEGYVGADSLGDALKGADIVVIPAGVPRKPGMTRDDLFNTNASIVMGLAEQAAKSCPNAALCIISNPVNSTVPIVAETLKRAGTYNPRKLFGVTTLDVVRANKFVGDVLGSDPATMNVPVIGGHAGKTILPLLSQLEGASFTDEQIAALTHRIQFGGDEVVQAKDGLGSATLSMAYAGASFALSLADALSGKTVSQCTFVESDKVDGLSFFSTPCELGSEGLMTIGDVPSNISAFEAEALEGMKEELSGSIAKGVQFVAEN